MKKEVKTWEQFFLNNPEFKTRKFGNWDKSDKACKVCGKMFKPKGPEHKICSDKCRQVSKTASFLLKNNNFDNWCRLRFEILKRDNFTCQYCGRNVADDGAKLHVDHIIPKNSNGTNDPTNLITSCLECNLGKSDVLLENREYLKK